MRILYLTMAEVDEASGVYKKIRAQAGAFERLGNECRVLFVKDSSEAMILFDSILKKVKIDKENMIKLSSYIISCDFCYVRFELLRHKVYKEILDNCKKMGIDILVEIPTYPPYQESLARVKDKIKAGNIPGAIKTLIGTIIVILDMYRLVGYSKMMCLVADDKKFASKVTVRIENGVDVTDNPFVYHEEENSINIIAVSNFAVWNGYDRAITGLKQYYDKTGKDDIRLTFVGDKYKAKELIKQAKTYNIEHLIDFTGALSGTQLTDAYAHADLALGALGNHRRKVFSNSSLKVKEYAARGMLMVLSDAEGVEYDIINKSFIVKSDESPIDFEAIRNWYINIENKKLMKAEIHNFANNHYSWDFQMKKIIDEYLKIKV